MRLLPLDESMLSDKNVPNKKSSIVTNANFENSEDQELVLFAPLPAKHSVDSNSLVAGKKRKAL